MAIKVGSDVQALLEESRALLERMDAVLDSLPTRKPRPEPPPPVQEDVFVTQEPNYFSSETKSEPMLPRPSEDDVFAPHELQTSGCNVDFEEELMDLRKELGIDGDVMAHASVEDLLDDGFDGDFSMIRPEGEGEGGQGGGMDELLRKAAFRNYQDNMSAHEGEFAREHFEYGEEDWQLKFRHGARQSTDDDVTFERIEDEIAARNAIEAEMRRTRGNDDHGLREHLDREFYRNNWD